MMKVHTMRPGRAVRALSPLTLAAAAIAIAIGAISAPAMAQSCVNSPQYNISASNLGKVNTGDIGNRTPSSDYHMHVFGTNAIKGTARCNYDTNFQPQGDVQVFRLFSNGPSGPNNRARVEAYSQPLAYSFPSSNPQTRHFSARFLVVQGQDGAIFQIKRPGRFWGLQLTLEPNGSNFNLVVTKKNGTVTTNSDNDRGTTSQVTAFTNVVGKAFDLVAVDDGKNYKLWLRSAGTGTSSATSMSGMSFYTSGSFIDQYEQNQGGRNNFRWGTYIGVRSPANNSTLLVSGARYGTLSGTTSGAIS